MSDLALRVERLGKKYRIGARQPRYGSLRDSISRVTVTGLHRLVRGSRRSAPRQQNDSGSDEIWALHDVSFEVRRGEVVGIIGRNGAGKSTLLKVLSRITEPTEGSVEVHGRVGSLLEVGTGFHQELSGRENIYLNGAILGMKRAEIDATFDAIVSFAEIDRFLDTPVKHYSSGMYVRLAFGVAAHLDPDILLVDEVLAVGDAAFQKKCIGKMSEVAHGGRTVLFVSHNMAAIQRLCTSAMLLQNGRRVAYGAVNDVVDAYLGNGAASTGPGEFTPNHRSGTGWARVVGIRMRDEHGGVVSALPCDADLRVEVDLALSDQSLAGASLRGLVLEVGICSVLGQPLLSLMNVDDDGVELPAVRACRVQLCLPGPTLVPGRYTVNLFLGIPFLQHVDEIPEAFTFEILPPRKPWRPYELYENRGVVCRKAIWRCVEASAG